MECRRERQFLIWVKDNADIAAERQRAQILLACSAQLTQETIASIVGCNRTTVVRTYRDWRDESRQALVDGRRFGTNKKPAAQIRALLKKLCASQPSEYGRSRSRWSVELLSLEVEQQLGWEVSTTQTYRYLKQAGCRWRKPRPTVDKAPADAEQTLDEMRRKLVFNRDPGSEVVLYQDEMKVELNPKVGADWMPRDHRKKLVTPGRNEWAYVAATYNPKTDHMVWAMSDSNDSDLLEVLLRMVADRYRGWETVHVVMDNYSTHTSNQTDRAIEELDGKIQRHFLPPYCPEANPIERVWWDVHDNVTRNHRCDSLESLLHEVYDYLQTRSYQGIEPAVLRRHAA